eukprot:scaffold139107_cov45-Attheya_sp.AAC.1
MSHATSLGPHIPFLGVCTGMEQNDTEMYGLKAEKTMKPGTIVPSMKEELNSLDDHDSSSSCRRHVVFGFVSGGAVVYQHYLRDIRCKDSWRALANLECTVATIDGLRQQGHDQTFQPRICSTGIFFYCPCFSLHLHHVHHYRRGYFTLDFSFIVVPRVNVRGWIGWRSVLPPICSRSRENAGELLGAGGLPPWYMGGAI